MIFYLFYFLFLYFRPIPFVLSAFLHILVKARKIFGQRPGETANKPRSVRISLSACKLVDGVRNSRKHWLPLACANQCTAVRSPNQVPSSPERSELERSSKPHTPTAWPSFSVRPIVLCTRIFRNSEIKKKKMEIESGNSSEFPETDWDLVDKGKVWIVICI